VSADVIAWAISAGEDPAVFAARADEVSNELYKVDVNGSAAELVNGVLGTLTRMKHICPDLMAVTEGMEALAAGAKIDYNIMVSINQKSEMKSLAEQALSPEDSQLNVKNKMVVDKLLPSLSPSMMMKFIDAMQMFRIMFERVAGQMILTADDTEPGAMPGLAMRMALESSVSVAINDISRVMLERVIY
jgi:hypothetical protein